MIQNVILFESYILLHCMYIPHFIYASDGGHLGCFHLSDNASSGGMNIIVQDLVESLFPILVGIYQGVIVFNFLRS